MFRSPEEKLFTAIVNSDKDKAFSLLEKHKDAPYTFDKTVSFKGKEYLLLTAFFMGEKPFVSFNILNQFIQNGYCTRMTDVNVYGAPKKESPLAEFLPHLFFFRNKKFPVQIPTNGKFNNSYENACYFFQTQMSMLKYITYYIFGKQNMALQTLNYIMDKVFDTIHGNNHSTQIFESIQTQLFAETFKSISINESHLQSFFIPSLRLHKDEEIGRLVRSHWSTFMICIQQEKDNYIISDIIENALKDDVFFEFFKAQCDRKENFKFFSERIPLELIENKMHMEEEKHDEVPTEDFNKTISLKIVEHED